MKNYYEVKQYDGCYTICSDDKGEDAVECSDVRGCNVRKTINALYAKDSAKFSALLAACGVSNTDAA